MSVTQSIKKLLAGICVLLLAALFLCVLWQVISRYVFKVPSTATDEVARFTFIWLTLLGTAYGFSCKSHLSLDLLKISLNEKYRLYLELLIECMLCIFFVLVLILGGSFLVLKTLSFGQTSPMLNMQMGYVYTVIPLSGFLALMFSTKNILTLAAEIQSDRA